MAKKRDKPKSPTSAKPRVTSSPQLTSRIGGITLPSRPPDPNVNFFDANRAGRAVVRPTDLVALRIELHNLTVAPGTPPRLQKTGTGAANLIIHFPPQAITEQTFFETKPKGTKTGPPPPAGVPDKPEPSGSEELTGPPVRARISGESRLAFSVPDGFDVDYTLQGILTAIETLPLEVAPNAKPPAPARRSVLFAEVFSSQLATLTATQRATLTSFAARSLRIAAVQGDPATFELRQAMGGPGLRERATLQISPDIGVIVAAGPQPAAPGSRQTAIELPWRLILSPHGAERWRHAKAPVTSPAGRTELWHSRLVAPDHKGLVIEPPHPDAQRTVRAVWALTGEGSTKPMQGKFPVSNDPDEVSLELPTPSTSPFRMPLDDFDRFQIAHLSSNFSRSGYAPRTVGANLLMLSALGGWLDSRGAWTVPPGMSVEEWVHHASMGRDHYVRVVYKGFAFPFGHKVALVKVSERKFHNGALDDDGNPTIEAKTGNTAYLRQRLYIVPRERELTFVEPALKSNDGTRFFQFQMPFSSVRLLTPVTPNLDRPDVAPSGIQIQGQPLSQQMFWPYVDGKPYRLQYSVTDLDGRTEPYDLPMIYIDNTLLPNMATAEAMCEVAKDAWDAAVASQRQAEFKRQRVAFAQSVKAGDTSVQVDKIGFSAEVEANNPTLRAYSANLTRPPFFPKVQEAWVRIAALAELTGSAQNNHVVWNAHYLQHGFDSNQGQVFIDVLPESGMAQLDFSSQGDRSGGFVQPNLKPSAISRLTGPVTGNVSQLHQRHDDGIGCVSDIAVRSAAATALRLHSAW